MHFQAAALTNATKDLYVALDKWDKDLIKYEELQQEKAAKGNAQAAGMLLNIEKNNARYNAITAYMSAVNLYVKALENELEKSHTDTIELQHLKRNIARIEKTMRVSLSDL